MEGTDGWSRRLGLNMHTIYHDTKQMRNKIKHNCRGRGRADKHEITTGDMGYGTVREMGEREKRKDERWGGM